MKQSIYIFVVVLAVQTSAVLTTRAAQLATASAEVAVTISAGGSSFGPTISADGRHVAWVSRAANLMTNESSREYNTVNSTLIRDDFLRRELP